MLHNGWDILEKSINLQQEQGWTVIYKTKQSTKSYKFFLFIDDQQCKVHCNKGIFKIHVTPLEMKHLQIGTFFIWQVASRTEKIMIKGT